MGGEEEGAYAQDIQGHQQTSGRGKELTTVSAGERDVLTRGGRRRRRSQGRRAGGPTATFSTVILFGSGACEACSGTLSVAGTLEPMDGFHFVAVLQFIPLDRGALSSLNHISATQFNFR